MTIQSNLLKIQITTAIDAVIGLLVWIKFGQPHLSIITSLPPANSIKTPKPILLSTHTFCQITQYANLFNNTLHCYNLVNMVFQVSQQCQSVLSAEVLLHELHQVRHDFKIRFYIHVHTFQLTLQFVIRFEFFFNLFSSLQQTILISNMSDFSERTE